MTNGSNKCQTLLMSLKEKLGVAVQGNLTQSLGESEARPLLHFQTWRSLCIRIDRWMHVRRGCT